MTRAVMNLEMGVMETPKAITRCGTMPRRTMRWTSSSGGSRLLATRRKTKRSLRIRRRRLRPAMRIPLRRMAGEAQAAEAEGEVAEDRRPPDHRVPGATGGADPPSGQGPSGPSGGGGGGGGGDGGGDGGGAPSQGLGQMLHSGLVWKTDKIEIPPFPTIPFYRPWCQTLLRNISAAAGPRGQEAFTWARKAMEPGRKVEEVRVVPMYFADLDAKLATAILKMVEPRSNKYNDPLRATIAATVISWEDEGFNTGERAYGIELL